MVHQLIASPYPDGHLVVRPGREGGIKIGVNRYAELRDTAPDAPVPGWLAAAVRVQWDQDVTGLTIAEAVMVRPETPYGYARVPGRATRDRDLQQGRVPGGRAAVRRLGHLMPGRRAWPRPVEQPVMNHVGMPV